MGVLKVKLKLGSAVVATSESGDAAATQEKHGAAGVPASIGPSPAQPPAQAGKAKRRHSDNKKPAEGSKAGPRPSKKRKVDGATKKKPTVASPDIPRTSSGKQASEQPPSPSAWQTAKGDAVDNTSQGAHGAAGVETVKQPMGDKHELQHSLPAPHSKGAKSKQKAQTIKLGNAQLSQDVNAEASIHHAPPKARKLEVKVKISTASKVKSEDRTAKTPRLLADDGTASGTTKTKSKSQKQNKPKKTSQAAIPVAQTSDAGASVRSADLQSKMTLEERDEVNGGRPLPESDSNPGGNPDGSGAPEPDIVKSAKQKTTPVTSKPAVKAQPRPPGPPKKDLLRIVDKIQQKDEYQIFGEPVTEEMAPGYFDVVTQPMDFLTIRKNVNAGDYGSWEELRDDLSLMFDNAMAYNSSDTIYHQVALTMKDLAFKMVELGKEGVQCFRGKTAAIMRAHNAAQRNAVLEALEAESLENLDDSAHAGENGQGYAIDFGAPRKGPGRPPGSTNAFKDLPSVRPSGEDYRHTYSHTAIGAVPPAVCVFAGVADGATTEGVAFGGGRPSLQRVQPLSEEAYVMSICRFVPRIRGAARELAMKWLAS